jgi:hypothetical protein
VTLEPLAQVRRELRSKCEAETKRGGRLQAEARIGGDAKALRAAMMHGPSCKRLAELFPNND